jgi:hypothetical protein
VTETQRPVSPLERERLALGELPPARAAEVRARLADADAEVAAIKADDARILADYPVARVAAEIRRRAARPRRARWVWIAAPALAAAAIVLVVRPGPKDPDPADMGVRAKGLQSHLVLHVQRGDAVVPLVEPAEARARDVLQVSYVAAGAAHGVVLSIDGGGVVTLHHPRTEHGDTALRPDGAVRLPQAYELDDAPGFERFVFVTAAAPIEPQLAVAAARAVAGAPDAATAPLSLPDGWTQRSFLVKKVDR